MSILKLALLALQVFNWLAKRIDQSEWERYGMLEQLQIERASYDAVMAKVDKAIAEAHSATDEERRNSLDQDL